MIKDDIRIYNNLSSLSEGFTSFLLEEVMKDKEKTTIALSGGSTPKVIFNSWSNESQNTIDWNNICLFWGDERCVPPSDPMSNYGMTKDCLLDRIKIPSSNIFRIHGENDPNEEAKRYSGILNKNLTLENGIPTFDLVMLGLGDDGHTVSIFPHEIELWQSTENCIVAKHPETGMKRISISGKIVNNALHVAFLATGANKAEKVRDIIRNRADFQKKYPAALVNPGSNYIYWFLDEAAASLL